jgi:hypothetical protein
VNKSLVTYSLLAVLQGVQVTAALVPVHVATSKVTLLFSTGQIAGPHFSADNSSLAVKKQLKEHYLDEPRSSGVVGHFLQPLTLVPNIMDGRNIKY